MNTSYTCLYLQQDPKKIKKNKKNNIMLILTTHLIHFWWPFIYVSSKACWISANCCYSPVDVNVNRPLPPEALTVAVWPASQLPALSLICICDPDKLIACNGKTMFSMQCSQFEKKTCKTTDFIYRHVSPNTWIGGVPRRLHHPD